MSKNGIQIVKRFWVNRRVHVFRFQSEFSRYQESVASMSLGPHAFERPWLTDVRKSESKGYINEFPWKKIFGLQSSEVLERLKSAWDENCFYLPVALLANARAPIFGILLLMNYNKFTWKLNVAKKCNDFRENDNWTMLSSTGRLHMMMF